MWWHHVFLWIGINQHQKCTWLYISSVVILKFPQTFTHIQSFHRHSHTHIQSFHRHSHTCVQSFNRHSHTYVQSFHRHSHIYIRSFHRHSHTYTFAVSTDIHTHIHSKFPQIFTHTIIQYELKILRYCDDRLGQCCLGIGEEQERVIPDSGMESGMTRSSSPVRVIGESLVGKRRRECLVGERRECLFKREMEKKSPTPF